MKVYVDELMTLQLAPFLHGIDFVAASHFQVFSSSVVQVSLFCFILNTSKSWFLMMLGFLLIFCLFGFFCNFLCAGLNMRKLSFLLLFTAQKMKFSIKDLTSEYDQIRRKLRI